MTVAAHTTRSVPASAWRAAVALLALLLYAAAALAQFPLPPDDPEGRVIADVIPQLPPTHASQAQKVMSLVSAKPGSKYSKAKVDEDVRKLYQTRDFRDVRARPVLAADGKVILFFEFDAYQGVIQEIVYKGAHHLKQDELDALTGLRRGNSMNPAANKLACQHIKQRYQEKGRLLTDVYLEEGTKISDTRVVFNVTEGPVARISSIHFTGQHFVTGPRLETQIKSSRQFLRLLGGQYNDAVVENDVIELRNYYKSFGFHDVKVSREIQWEPDLRHARLIFHIDEGQRYHISNVTLRGAKTFSEDEILRFVKLRPGDIYSQGTVDTDKKTIADFYGLRGYGVAPHEEVYYPQDRPGEVDVHYQLEERPPAKVGEIITIGNTVTRDNVIRRQVPLYPGQVLTYPDLRVAENNLARLGIFTVKPDQGIKPTVTVDENTDSEFKNVYVNVEETQTGSLMFGVGVNSNSGLTGSIVLNERNFDITRPPTSLDDLLSGRAFRGAGQEFRIEAMPGTVYQRYSVTFREPYLFDTPYSLTTSGYYYTRYFTEYTEVRVGSQLSLGRQLSQFWSASAGLRLEDVGIHNVPSFAPFDYTSVAGNSNFILGLRTGLRRDSRDSYLRATQGSVLNMGYEEVLGTFTFPTTNADFTKYWTTYQRADGSGRHVLAMRSQVAFTGSHAPVFERQFAGGIGSIRGFQFRGVGPNDLGFMVGGDFMLLNSLEYQIPVRANDQLYFVGFVDSGTVERSVEIRDYRVSAGFGVRVVVPMMGPMPIALDFAFPLNQAPTDRTQVFNFWMGYFH